MTQPDNTNNPNPVFGLQFFAEAEVTRAAADADGGDEEAGG